MSDQPGIRSDSSPPAADSGGIGCLAGIGTAIAIPTVVFCGILIANALNPSCGTPGDSGGCEMGLASGTIGAIVIGLALGAVVAILTTIAGRRARERHSRATPPGEMGLAARDGPHQPGPHIAADAQGPRAD
jgi:hypothetical protein